MATNDLYQSKFMPIFEKADNKIKELVLTAFLLQMPINALRNQINGVIQWAVSLVPPDLRDKTAYARGLKGSSEKYILQYYKKPQRQFEKTKNDLLSTLPKGTKAPIVDTPKELIDFTKDKKNLWADAKGSPNVVNYEKEIKARIQKLASEPATTIEPGKKPISLWQKAELDVRHENQVKETQDLIAQGVELVWISSHPNCSKRCETWQGHLFSLTKHAKNPQTTVDKKFRYNKRSFEVGEVDGHKIYSLPDIMAVTDQYGYNNNIISGFNCRHKRIPYKAGTVAPKEYTAGEVAKKRDEETTIREMERELRKIKTTERLYNKINDVKAARHYSYLWKEGFKKYQAYCESKGYAWYKYRCGDYS